MTSLLWIAGVLAIEFAPAAIMAGQSTVEPAGQTVPEMPVQPVEVEAAEEAAAEQPAAEPAGPPAPPAALVHPDPAVDTLLTALETADADLATMRGDLIYLRFDAVLDDRQYRWGTLRFASMDRGEDAPQLRVFRADFNRYFDGVSSREEDQSWVFDGRWLMEQDFADKRFRKVEIAPAGANFDPMKLGEGPLAIPIGQKKAEILARFEVDARPVWEGIEPPQQGDERDWDRNFRANVMGQDQEVVQLRLVPRVIGTAEFDEIRLWYVKGGASDAGGVEADRWTPRLVRTSVFSADGSLLDETTVQLTGVVVNDPGDIVAVMIDEPKEEDGWRITVDRLEAGGGA